MTTNKEDIAREFIESIRAFGDKEVRVEELGPILVSFPVIGGGSDCIVLRVGAAVVRLTLQDGGWHAEELVVRGG